MQVHLCGDPTTFDAVPAGGLFWVGFDGQANLAIKTESEDAEPGAVLLSSDPDQCAQHFVGRAFQGYPVLGLPKARMIPSIEGAGLPSLGRGVNMRAGYLYLYEDATTLAFKHNRHTYLLNLSDGRLYQRQQQSVPVEVARWLIASAIWDRPVTLLAYPAGVVPIELR